MNKWDDEDGQAFHSARPQTDERNDSSTRSGGKVPPNSYKVLGAANTAANNDDDNW